MSVEEAILDQVRRLPPAKQEEVLRFAEHLRCPSEVKIVPYKDYKKEMAWLAANRSKYPNLWVALDGDRIIAADPDVLKVHEAAKAQGIDDALLSHILPDDGLPFIGGW